MKRGSNSLYADKERVFLVLELVQDVGPTPAISVVASLPGRDGTMRKSWRTVQGRLDSKQTRDLLGWLELTSANALLAWCGSQEVLPMA